jgi:hypothetical protein
MAHRVVRAAQIIVKPPVRGSMIEVNWYTFKHSPRNHLINDSMKAFFIVLLGRMKSSLYFDDTGKLEMLEIGISSHDPQG